MVEHLTPARPNSALIQLFAEISNQRQHLFAIIFAKMRQHWRSVIFLQRILPQLTPLFRQRLFLSFTFVVANQFIKHPAHIGHMCGQRPGQLRPVSKVHRPRQPRTIKLIRRKRLGLFVVNALQQVFQTPQEQIRHSQLFSIVFRKQMQLGNGAERWQ